MNVVRPNRTESPEHVAWQGNHLGITWAPAVTGALGLTVFVAAAATSPDPGTTWPIVLPFCLLIAAVTAWSWALASAQTFRAALIRPQDLVVTGKRRTFRIAWSEITVLRLQLRPTARSDLASVVIGVRAYDGSEHAFPLRHVEEGMFRPLAMDLLGPLRAHGVPYEIHGLQAIADEIARLYAMPQPPARPPLPAPGTPQVPPPHPPAPPP